MKGKMRNLGIELRMDRTGSGDEWIRGKRAIIP